MKVISGIYGSRKLISKDGLNTRPTLDKVKQAIFNIIGTAIKDSVCLDLFSGSGQLGIECISRGSKKVYFNDNDFITFKIIQKNINSLQIDKKCYELTKYDYKRAILSIKEKLDIVLLDPPYKKTDYYYESLKLLNENDLLNEKAIIVCETDSSINLVISEYFNKKIYKYGNTNVVILTKNS